MNANKTVQSHEVSVSEYILKFDETEAAHLLARATERGYASLIDYLRALVAADALVDALRDDWQNTEPSAEEIEHSLRDSWHAAQTGRVLPIENLWDILDNDE